MTESREELAAKLEKANEEIAELKTELALRWETIETYISREEAHHVRKESTEMEKLVPLDISDAIALAERQRQEIAELKAEVHKYKLYYFARFGKLLKEDTPCLKP